MKLFSDPNPIAPRRFSKRFSPILSGFAVLALWTTLAATTYAEGRGLTALDLVSMNRLSDPQVSPDGEHIVYVLRETDLEADKGRTDLWLMPSDGSSATPTFAGRCGVPSALNTHQAALTPWPSVSPSAASFCQ